MQAKRKKPRIGLVLGSGSARGWAHIGVIHTLEAYGIRPDIVCGCSIGALVGAAYAAGSLDKLQEWVGSLDAWDMVKLMDISLDGGLIEGDTLMASYGQRLSGLDIAQLDLPYAAVATDLQNGREVWLQEGDVLDTVRASIALPGLFTPVRSEGRWLVDGGLVNPVPISLCRAMGAERIIAVNLNGDILGKHLRGSEPEPSQKWWGDSHRDLFKQWYARVNNDLIERAVEPLLDRLGSKVRQGHDEGFEAPGLFEVTASAINIMQDRITRSRMAGDPPDILISPRLAHLGLMEFDRADEAIKEGERATERQKSLLQELLGELGK